MTTAMKIPVPVDFLDDIDLLVGLMESRSNINPSDVSSLLGREFDDLCFLRVVPRERGWSHLITTHGNVFLGDDVRELQGGLSPSEDGLRRKLERQRGSLLGKGGFPDIKKLHVCLVGEAQELSPDVCRGLRFLFERNGALQVNTFLF